MAKFGRRNSEDEMRKTKFRRRNSKDEIPKTKFKKCNSNEENLKSKFDRLLICIVLFQTNNLPTSSFYTEQAFVF